MIAVDTSVLVDYIGDGPSAAAAEDALRLALSAGPVVACEIVVSEVIAGLGHAERLRRGTEGARLPRSVPDFLIGAHALLQCQGLITRDDAFFRDYFKGLKVIVPKAS